MATDNAWERAAEANPNLIRLLTDSLGRVDRGSVNAAEFRRLVAERDLLPLVIELLDEQRAYVAEEIAAAIEAEYAPVVNVGGAEPVPSDPTEADEAFHAAAAIARSKAGTPEAEAPARVTEACPITESHVPHGLRTWGMDLQCSGLD